MKIEFDQSGGVMGLVKSCEIDCRSTSSTESRQIEDLVHNANFFAAKVRPVRVSVDAMKYRVLIETDDHRRELHLSSDNTPKSFAPLLRFLTEKAQFKRQSASSCVLNR